MLVKNQNTCYSMGDCDKMGDCGKNMVKNRQHVLLHVCNYFHSIINLIIFIIKLLLFMLLYSFSEVSQLVINH